MTTGPAQRRTPWLGVLFYVILVANIVRILWIQSNQPSWLKVLAWVTLGILVLHATVFTTFAVRKRKQTGGGQ
jgi:hypothetical protein